MPDNKKHHFVPKFYLTRFSDDGKSINAYVLKSSKKVLSANLANQCYRDYFCDFWQRPISDMGETEQPAASLDRSCRWPLQRRQSLKVFEAGKRWRNLGYLKFIDRRGGHPFTEP